MPYRVLVAEGDHNLQQSVAHVLNNEHFDTVCADDGMAALILLNETAPDLLIAEIALPGKSGYELCRYVREEPEYESLPVILLDSRFEVIHQNAAQRSGADAYLSRPFEPSEMVGIVRRLLESRKKTNDEESAPAVAAPNRQSPLSETPGSEETEAVAFERLVLATDRTPDRQTVTAGSPGAVPLRPRWSKSIGLWTALAGVSLLALVLAVFEQTHRSNDPTVRQEPLPVEPAQGNTTVIEGQLLANTLPGQGAGSPNAEGASASEGGALSTAGLDQGVEAVQANPPDDASGATGEPNSEKSRSESRQDSAAVASRKEIPAAGINQPNNSPARPRSVRSTKPGTAGSHLKRSGREMKEAGKHFGSGAKHFGQGSGKAVLWAGNRIGRGVKGIGTAFKKLF